MLATAYYSRGMWVLSQQLIILTATRRGGMVGGLWTSQSRRDYIRIMEVCVHVGAEKWSCLYLACPNQGLSSNDLSWKSLLCLCLSFTTDVNKTVLFLIKAYWGACLFLSPTAVISMLLMLVFGGLSAWPCTLPLSRVLYQLMISLVGGAWWVWPNLGYVQSIAHDKISLRFQESVLIL